MCIRDRQNKHHRREFIIKLGHMLDVLGSHNSVAEPIKHHERVHTYQLNIMRGVVPATTSHLTTTNSVVVVVAFCSCFWRGSSFTSPAEENINIKVYMSSVSILQSKTLRFTQCWTKRRMCNHFLRPVAAVIHTRAASPANLAAALQLPEQKQGTTPADTDHLKKLI